MTKRNSLVLGSCLYRLKVYITKAVNERVSIDRKVCHGQACIRGTRIPVHQIVRMLANGDSVESLLKAYPTIHRQDILAIVVMRDEVQSTSRGS